MDGEISFNHREHRGHRVFIKPAFLIMFNQDSILISLREAISALGKALLPGEQGLRETEVVGPVLAG